MTFAWDDVTVAVEFAFGHTFFDTNPTWSDQVDVVEAIDTKRGRNSLLQRYPAGTGAIRLDNSDGRFDPNNSSSPHSPNVKIGVPVRIRVTHNTITYTVFRGVVARWPLEYGYREYATVTVPIVDGTKILNRDGSVSTSFTAQRTDERVTDVLDEVGWDATLRDIDSGVAQVQALTVDGADARDLIQAAADVEVGHFFIAADGKATFRARTVHSGGVTAQATFGPNNIHYETITPDYDEDDVYNEARITRDGGEEQVHSDQTAIADLGYTVTLSQSDGHHLNDPTAQNSAQWLVERHKVLKVEVRGLSFAPNVVDEWPTALGLDLREAVNVKVDPPGGGDDLDQDPVIEAVSHKAEKGGKWVTTFGLRPLSDLETEDFIVFDSYDFDDPGVFA